MIIGFNGSMGVGKSTAIKVIQDNLHLKTVVLKFAQPLYDMQEMIYRRINSVYERPENFVKDRKLLQWLGTDWGREISETLWVDLWMQQVAVHLNKGFIVLCDDVRYDNEAELIKKLKGSIIKITSNKNSDRINVKAGIPNHKSESGVHPDFVDFVVENNDTLEKFENTLNKVYKHILPSITTQKSA